jgi:hypothetical protein
VGDLANEDLTPINKCLGMTGIYIEAVNTFSMDTPESAWVFDTVLADRDAITAK